MQDVYSLSLRAAAVHDLWAPALVFAAGAASCIGPCVAPRFLAVAGLTADCARGRSLLLVSSFVAGIAAAYGAFAGGVLLLTRVAQYSGFVYAFLAALLSLSGIRSLWRLQECCVPAGRVRNNAGAGSAFFLGASSALVLSPCCMPMIAGVAAYAGANGGVLYSSFLLTCFAAGHALPLFGVAAGTRKIGVLLQQHAVRGCASIVSGTLMLGLGAFYAVLV